MGKVGDDKELGVGVKEPQKPDHEYFLALINRKIPKKKAKILAGFSPNTKTREILKTKKTMKAAKTREEVNMVLDSRKFVSAQEAREVLSKEPLHCFAHKADRLTDIIYDEDVDEKVAISAIKAHNEMFGDNAPQQVQIESKSLVVELNGLSKEHLEYLRDNKMQL